MPTLGEVSQFIGVCVLAFNCWQQWNNSRRSKKIAADVKNIRVQTDGINAHLVKVVGEAEHAKGVKQGEDNPRPGS